MPHRKSRKSKAKSSFPDRQIIAKAEGRFAKADKQRVSIKADPKRAVMQEKNRAALFKSSKTTVTAVAKEIYSSSNGDRWFLDHDADSGRVYIRHVANAASGGHKTIIEIDAFLSGQRGSPECQALIRLIGTLANR
jgi:hypothetical protein